VRAIVYSEAGASEVLRLVERPAPVPGPGEVRVRMHVSGVNPTDWKARRRGPSWAASGVPEVVPNQDGAGVIDAVGEGVPESRVGERVWVWEAAWRRAEGTAQELVTLPSRQAVVLPHGASFDVGAALGIPALTAHRCLTVAEGGPARLEPESLAGTTVLVAGGAGAVGHAAIQLARWAGARVFATVSGEDKADLARAAGADHVASYHRADAWESIRAHAPDGVDVVVEVAPSANAALDAAVIAPNGTVAVYAVDGGSELPVSWELMQHNVAYRFVLVYTVPAEAKLQAVDDVTRAVADGALPVGREAGLPLHRFPLERTADAHDAVEAGAVGKVLIDVA
jgi:NADPH2:quinone reductase